MASIFRIGAALTGFTGGPGVNTWYWSRAIGLGDLSPTQVSLAADAMRAFYFQTLLNYPNEVTIQVEPFATVLESTDGSVRDLVSAQTTPASVRGGGAGSTTSRATQMCMNLRTGVPVRRRLLRGRLFLGPLDNGAITDAGGIVPGSASGTVAAYAASIQGLTEVQHIVWSRPVFKPRANEGDPLVVDQPGNFGLVSAVDVKPLPATLRSRRD